MKDSNGMIHAKESNDIIEYKSIIPDDLIKELQKSGYTVIGPSIKNQTIYLEEIQSENDLPRSYTDEQEKAYYSITKNGNETYFNYSSTPNSWKQFLFTPKSRIFNALKDGKELKLEFRNNDIRKYAFFGVKSCELEAIKIQDKVFMEGEFKDSFYKQTRENSLIIGINCLKSGNTCFCNSMGTGPEFKTGYDILLAEVVNDKEHDFIASAGSEKGKTILNKVTNTRADDSKIKQVKDRLKEISGSQKRSIDNSSVKELLYNNFEHPRWDNTAKRCFTCTNCTLVCPTCFCSTMEDTTDLKGNTGERWRKWDSCFNLSYAKVAGGNFRPSPKGRYRQWLTHKFAYWKDQFGTSGCVGCGRCITWCPAKIDVTEEINAIALTPEKITSQ